MNSEGEPPQKKKKTNLSPSLLSLPDEIIANCLAHISRSYYPELSLVCKTFRSLILSKELSNARLLLGNTQYVLHVCLQLPDRKHPSWFSLWIKPHQTLNNDLDKCSKITRLVQTPSSYSTRVPFLRVRVGSECWLDGFSQTQYRSSVMKWNVAGPKESANWAEVFDPKTQTWETLPDPGIKIRCSKIKAIDEIKEKLYFRSYDEKEDYVFDPKEGKWDVVAAIKMDPPCVVENVCYICYEKNCLWYDIKLERWRAVRGLDVLIENLSTRMIKVANYGGKLLMLGDKPTGPGRNRYKFIWCAEIALERRDDGEVWGNTKWANVVLKVPSSYVYLRTQVDKI
ncbi:unnamed protein product [Microthlaspi erraticum]|uniref:F-box domain-containing protein n=1 Tax=Microthlaspi erraticum TaxID=1685480 RepID=A0A6D2L5D3_9BRAS|nr:unnamed protein product [Microthlaspi erraticum]